MQRLLPWSIALLAIIALGALFSRYLDQERELVALRGKQAKLAQNEQIADQRWRQAKSELEGAAKSQKAAQDAAKSSSSMARYFISMEAMRKDPRYAGVWRQMQERNVQRQYGAAIAAMKLPADQEKQLRALLIERSETAADARSAATESGLSDKEVNRATNEATNQVNDEIKGLIGDAQDSALEGASRLDSFITMMSFSVEPDLAVAGAPLAPDQTYSLAKIYADTLNGHPAANGEADVGTLNARNQAIVYQAAAILSSVQIGALKQSMLTDQLQQQYFDEQRKAQGSGSGASGLTVIGR